MSTFACGSPQYFSMANGCLALTLLCPLCVITSLVGLKMMNLRKQYHPVLSTTLPWRGNDTIVHSERRTQLSCIANVRWVLGVSHSRILSSLGIPQTTDRLGPKGSDRQRDEIHQLEAMMNFFTLQKTKEATTMMSFETVAILSCILSLSAEPPSAMPVPIKHTPLSSM